MIIFDAKQRFKEVFFVVAGFLAKSIHFSFILGSKAAFFSAGQCISSAIGFFGGPISAILAYTMRFFISCLFTKAPFLLISLYHIPTLMGTLYLSSSSRLFRALIPALCMVLFIIHPVGSQAPVYALYWLIPIALAFSSRRSIFLESLGSTFTAHATGSIIWLYTGSLQAETWNALITVVWAERLLLATGLTTAYYTIVHAQSYIEKTYPEANDQLVRYSTKLLGKA
jgi:hypothetical protein